MLLAVNPFAGIVEVTAFAGSVYAACFLPTIIVGLFWRGTAQAAMVSILLGSLSVTAWFFTKQMGWTSWHEIYIGILVGMLSYVALSLLKPSKKRQDFAKESNLTLLKNNKAKLQPKTTYENQKKFS